MLTDAVNNLENDDLINKNINIYAHFYFPGNRQVFP